MFTLNGHGVRPVRVALAAMLVAVFASTSASAQFFATPESDGDLLVLDSFGAEMTVVASDPVGVRPDVCPSGAYHVAEVPEDISQLVLTDCATGEGQFTVEILGSE